MTAFAGAVDATFAAFGIDATYTPAGGGPVPVRVIARPPAAIVSFGETRIHAETATFELRAIEVAGPRPDDQLVVGGVTFIMQAEPERRDPDRLVWTLIWAVSLTWPLLLVYSQTVAFHAFCEA